MHAAEEGFSSGLGRSGLKAQQGEFRVIPTHLPGEDIKGEAPHGTGVEHQPQLLLVFAQGGIGGLQFGGSLGNALRKGRIDFPKRFFRFNDFFSAFANQHMEHQQPDARAKNDNEGNGNGGHDIFL